MKRDYIRLFSFMIGVTLLLSAVIYAISNSYKQSRQKEMDSEIQIIDEIGIYYDTFQIKVEEFKDTREKTLSAIEDYSSYYTGMDEKYPEIVEQIKKYDTKVKELADADTYLNEYCINKSYSDSVTNQKCINYIMNYEKSVNTFIGDINFFNNKVDQYNKWTETENNSDAKKRTYEKIEQYTSNNFKDYVDINKDGTYLGKVEK